MAKNEPIEVSSLKVVLPFKAGNLPVVDPNNPKFTLRFPDGRTVACAVNAKAARRLAGHRGGAALQGKLISEKGNLVLCEAGFQLFEIKSAEVAVKEDASSE